MLAEIKADPELRRIPVVVLTTSEAEQDIVDELRPARQLLHQQAGRPGAIHRRGPLDRGLLARDREATASRVTTPLTIPWPPPTEQVIRVLLIEDNPADVDLIRRRSTTPSEPRDRRAAGGAGARAAPGRWPGRLRAPAPMTATASTWCCWISRSRTATASTRSCAWSGRAEGPDRRPERPRRRGAGRPGRPRGRPGLPGQGPGGRRHPDPLDSLRHRAQAR